MTANDFATTFRKRQRRHARLTAVLDRDRHPVRVIVLPAPGGVPAASPAPATDPVSDRDDLALATWEDAEWR
jgi:hypothetical protein